MHSSEIRAEKKRGPLTWSTDQEVKYMASNRGGRFQLKQTFELSEHPVKYKVKGN